MLSKLVKLVLQFRANFQSAIQVKTISQFHVELTYYLASNYFSIHTIGGIIQNSHPFATASQHLHPSPTAFTNNGSTTRDHSRLCAFSPGILLDSFPCPQLLSAPVFSVIPSFVNSLTYASDLGGGTQTQPKTATQPQAKVENCARQIVMRMRYHTMQPAPQAITIRSALNSITKCQIDFNIIFGYFLIAHNNQIDSQEQIEVEELKIQNIKFKYEKDGQDI